MTSQSSTKNGTGVTHLPECLYTGKHPHYVCICAALRACEQRVLGLRLDDLNVKSFNAALDAAEKAVADIDGEEMCCACNDDYRMTISAIRALKEKP